MMTMIKQLVAETAHENENDNDDDNDATSTSKFQEPVVLNRLNRIPKAYVSEGNCPLPGTNI